MQDITYKESEETMKKTNQNLITLNCLFVISLIVANIIASKIVTFGYAVLPAAVVAYPLTFLMTDIIGEIWGKEEANKTVRRGFICQITALILISLAILLPVAPFANNQTSFSAILGSSFRVTFASLVSYICSQSWDVFIFHKLKVKNEGRCKWLRNNISTMTSQIIDTAIFITIAFYGTVPSILTMIISQYSIKCLYALLDTPFFYFFTRGNRHGTKLTGCQNDGEAV